MIVIVAGSRNIDDYNIVAKAIDESGFNISTILHGGCKGPDQFGGVYAKSCGIPELVMKADWTKYGKSAGPIRNGEMIKHVGSFGALVAIWDGVSKGTFDIIYKAHKAGLPVFVKCINQ